MELAEMQVALGNFSKQLAILQSYLSLKFGLEFQEFYDKSLRIIVTAPVIQNQNPVVTTRNEVFNKDRSQTELNEATGGHSSGRSGEIEVESPFVCVKNEVEEIEDVKLITSDLEGEDPLAMIAVKSTVSVVNKTEQLEDGDGDDDVDSPLEIMGYDHYTNDDDVKSESDDADESSKIKSRKRGRRKRQHSDSDSTDEEYKVEEHVHGSSTSDDDEQEPSFWVMGQDGPVQTPRSSGVKNKDNLSKKSGQNSKQSHSSSKSKSKSKSSKKSRKKKKKLHLKPEITNDQVTDKTIKAIDKTKPIPNCCAYCHNTLVKEELSEFLESIEGSMSSNKRPVCKSCEKVSQNTEDKLKNIWSSILPSVSSSISKK